MQTAENFGNFVASLGTMRSDRTVHIAETPEEISFRCAHAHPEIFVKVRVENAIQAVVLKELKRLRAYNSADFVSGLSL